MSDDEGQFGECVGETESRTDIGPEIVETPAEVLNEGMAGGSRAGSANQARHRVTASGIPPDEASRDGR
jgi:hypothetical protein